MFVLVFDRDPGILGLLPYGGEKRYPLYYGLIVDGFHTHDASIRLAYAMHPAGDDIMHKKGETEEQTTQAHDL